MPTLLSTSLPVKPTAPIMAPAALTLSFGGVEFSLTPTDNAAEVSYRNNGQGVLLSLTSFTGSLQVSMVQQLQQPTVMMPSMTAKMVVEEPHSPELAQKANHVTPAGQQRLSFTTGKAANKAVTQKKKEIKPKDRKRTVDVNKDPRSSAVKKTRREDSNKENQAPTPLAVVAAEVSSKPPSFLGQTQPTQEIPDLSQTMDTSDLSELRSAGNDDSSSLFRIQSTGSADKPKDSVQEILDRVNSSNDSIATVRDDDNSITSANDTAAKYDSELVTTAIEAPNDNHQAGPISAAVAPATNSPSSKGGYSSPCPRWGHSMTKVKGNTLLIYGGQSFDLEGNPTMLSDVHAYDIATRTWSKPINCRGDARQWHSTTFLPERQLLIAFGGETVDPTKLNNKVVTSDTLRVLDTDIMLWYPPAVSGDVPTGRSGHTATLLPNTNELVLFGGVKGSKWLNSVSVLDTVRWIWTTPKVQGAAPKPRSYHSATAVKGKNAGYKLVIFGGNNKSSCFDTVHVLETDEENKWKWSHPSVNGKPPFPRTGHSATLLEDGKTVCIYGGWDPNEEDSATGGENIFQGSFLLDTETWMWSAGPKAVPGGSGSETAFVADCGPKRCGHSSVLNPENGQVMVFGGRIPGEVLAGDFQYLSSEEKLVGLDGK